MGYGGTKPEVIHTEVLEVVLLLLHACIDVQYVRMYVHVGAYVCMCDKIHT